MNTQDKEKCERRLRKTFFHVNEQILEKLCGM